MLSKPVLVNATPQTSRTTKNDTVPLFTYRDFFKKNIELKKYKVPELKSIAKHHRLHITGKKDVLIERIENLFVRMKHAEKIQRIFRGWLVRFSFKMRGEAFKTRSICVNDTDFCTLEPIEEIPMEYFYSYRDRKDFVYGFNLTSLIQLFKKNQKLENPYNREQIDREHIRNIIFLNNIIPMIFGERKVDQQHIKIVREEPIAENRAIPNLSVFYYRPQVLIPYSEMSSELRMNLQKIVSSRNMPIQRRMQELFMEIDRLGNYTQSAWFTNLDRTEYIRLYRTFFEIWNFRGQIPNNIKSKISPLVEPFANIFSSSIHTSEVTLEQIQMICVTVMENLIYTGIDEEYRKIGALHVLSGLTIVSGAARIAMPWLYESIVY